jgi:ribonucleotide reductase alpha subunit
MFIPKGVEVREENGKNCFMMSFMIGTDQQIISLLSNHNE